MATNNSVNVELGDNADGGQLKMGTVARILKWLGADITLTGSGSNVYTFPNATGTVALLSTVYPVGSIYMSTASTNPSTLFGGTWAATGVGSVLVGVGTSDAAYAAGATGGASTVTLGTTQIPSHTHTQDFHTHTQNSHNHTQDAHSHDVEGRNNSAFGTELKAAKSSSATGGASVITTGARAATATNQAATATNQNTTATNQNTGGGLSHNNMPPYLVVYMWKRTA